MPNHTPPISPVGPPPADTVSGSPKKLSSRSTISDLAKLIVQVENEKLEHLNPRDIVIPRRRTKTGRIIDQRLLSPSAKAYRRKRQLAIYQDLLQEQHKKAVANGKIITTFDLMSMRRLNKDETSA